MGIQRLNHAVLFVRDVQRSAEFYRELLGFRTVHASAKAVFLRAADSDNDHDLGLFQIDPSARDSGAGRDTVGLYHLAWSVGTLAELATLAGKLADAGALVGASDHTVSKSLYAKDPDGIEFEVAWFVPREQVTEEMAEQSGIRPLDLDRELDRWGADLVGAP